MEYNSDRLVINIIKDVGDIITGGGVWCGGGMTGT